MVGDATLLIAPSAAVAHFHIQHRSRPSEFSPIRHGWRRAVVAIIRGCLIPTVCPLFTESDDGRTRTSEDMAQESRSNRSPRGESGSRCAPLAAPWQPAPRHGPCWPRSPCSCFRCWRPLDTQPRACGFASPGAAGPNGSGKGTIAVSQGTLSEPAPLGIEADEPGSMWLDGRAIDRSASGAHGPTTASICSVTAPLDAKLLVQLTAADDPQRGPPIEVPLADLSGEFRNLQLDSRDNRLLVRRTPGDQLRVRRCRTSRWSSRRARRCELEVEPHLLPLPTDSKVRIKVQLFEADSQRELWSTHHDVPRRAGRRRFRSKFRLPERRGRLRPGDLGRSRARLAASGPPDAELEEDHRRNGGCRCWCCRPSGRRRQARPSRVDHVCWRSIRPIRDGGRR